MKRIMLFGNILMLASAIMMTSCNKAPDTPKERQYIELTKAQQLGIPVIDEQTLLDWLK